MRASIQRVERAHQNAMVGYAQTPADWASYALVAAPLGAAAYFGYKWWGIGGAIGLPFAVIVVFAAAVGQALS